MFCTCKINLSSCLLLQSAVVLALVATNPAAKTDVATEKEIRAHVENLNAQERKRTDAIKSFEAKKSRELDALEDSFAFNASDNFRFRETKKFEAKKSRELSLLAKSLKEKHLVDRSKLKTTVILTSVSLIGQW